MNIATRLDNYLTEHDMSYQVVPHYHSNSSIGSAVAAQIPLNQIAKAVLLSDHEGRKIMAVLPANNRISLSALNEKLHASYQLVKENEVYSMFADCEKGAIPPVASAYNMPMVCDKILDQLETVYIEAGDHETLLRLDRKAFEIMMEEGRHLHFSREVYH
jgi:Ala-tRNA(Pro) deacylase